MSYTVTLTKKPGSAEANLFIGNRAGAGSALSDWQVVQRDDEIEYWRIIFNVIESTDPKLFQPTLNIRYGEDYARSSTYPSKSPLQASSVKTWILNFIKKNQADLNQLQSGKTDEVVEKPKQNPVSSKREATQSEPVQTTPIPVQGSQSWLKPAIFAGTMLGAVLAGVGIGLAVTPEETDNTPLFLVNNNGDVEREKWGQSDD